MLLSNRSLANLKGLHPDLVRVVSRAASAIPDNSNVTFIVTEGCRTLDKQRQLVAAGASRTLNSRHIPSGEPPLGKAFDVAVMVSGEVRWDWPLYESMSSIIKQAAVDCGVAIQWGGDWPSFRDGPHYELSRSVYP